MNRHRPIYYEIWEIEVEGSENGDTPSESAKQNEEIEALRQELRFLKQREAVLKAALNEAGGKVAEAPTRPSLKEKFDDALDQIKHNWDDTKQA